MSTFSLSVAAFVLAVVANVWNFVLVYVRWPRVSVEMRAYVYAGFGNAARTEPAPSQGRMVVTVINRGSEAVTVCDVGLEPQGGGGPKLGYETDEMHDRTLLPTTNHEPLPLRLEGRGALRWIYGPEQLRHVRDGTTMIAYAKVYRAFRFRKAITERKIYALKGRVKQ